MVSVSSEGPPVNAGDSVARHALLVLGNPAGWPRREDYGYRNSLALCIIDSIQSLGVKYSSVENVVSRYKQRRLNEGADPFQDGVGELLETFNGGADSWANLIGNGNRTSTSMGAPLKAEAIRQAAVIFQEAGLLSTADLRSADPESVAAVKKRWHTLPGQRSGISWRYMLMLAGSQGVKPDRMIFRFVAAATDTPENRFTTSGAATAVEDASKILGVNTTDLDHAIWRWQREQGRSGPAAEQVELEEDIEA